MNKPLSRAIKLRDKLLSDLNSEICVIVQKDNDTFARDIEHRVLKAKPFYVDPDALSFLLENASALNVDDFYQGLANIRMPFDEIWLEMDAKYPESKTQGRIGATLEHVEDGLRVFVVKLFKLPDSKKLTVHYSSTEITFHYDGTVNFSETPIAYLYDSFTEQKMGKLSRGQKRSETPIDPDTVRTREQEDLQYATRCAAVIMTFTSLYNRPTMVHVEELSPPSKKAKKALEQKGRKSPEFSLSKIRLGQAAYQEIKHTSDQVHREDGKQKRTAHWVRGHLFLARNGRLTWRQAHVRGVGKPAMKARQITR